MSRHAEIILSIWPSKRNAYLVISGGAATFYSIEHDSQIVLHLKRFAL
jgi:hypothetical protein